jgi:hypothetical protein
MSMNSSDQPLNSFEEKLTAYLDQRLSPEEAALFEHEHPEVVAERAAARGMQDVLKRASVAPPLPNVEFFNHQILREIAPASSGHAVPKPPLFNIWRLVLAGAVCLLAALGIYKSFVPTAGSSPTYFAEVLSTKAGDDSLTARVIREDGLSVVMIDGLAPISEDYILN